MNIIEELFKENRTYESEQRRYNKEQNKLFNKKENAKSKKEKFRIQGKINISKAKHKDKLIELDRLNKKF